MGHEQSAQSQEQATRLTIDSFNMRGVDVFTVLDGKVAAKFAYVKG